MPVRAILMFKLQQMMGAEYDSCQGCTDEFACNFDPLANVESDDCTYAEEGLDCDGNCLSDEDGDGYCDPEVTGCTDARLWNYIEIATEEDGSCEYCSCYEDPQAGYGILVEVHTQSIQKGFWQGSPPTGCTSRRPMTMTSSVRCTGMMRHR